MLWMLVFLMTCHSSIGHQRHSSYTPHSHAINQNVFGFRCCCSALQDEKIPSGSHAIRQVLSMDSSLDFCIAGLHGVAIVIDLRQVMDIVVVDVSCDRLYQLRYSAIPPLALAARLHGSFRLCEKATGTSYGKSRYNFCTD